MVKAKSYCKYEALQKRLKSTDFPLQCRGMYYFAKGRHAHQTRKVSGFPYFVHPRMVAYVVMMYNGTTDQINAAFGHDLLEDTETSYMEIAAVTNSVHCADLCTELRNNRYTIKDIGKEEYINEKLVNLSDDALLVKLADMFCNMSDNPTEQTVLRMQTNINYLLAHKEMNSTYKLLAEDIIEAGNVILEKSGGYHGMRKKGD